MRHNYIPPIDGLRALAVIAVMVFHLDSDLLPGGFTGVDIFFVISGYVVSQSLAAHSDGKFSSFILIFYRRRILRIFPALLVCLLITTVVVVLLIPQAWLSKSISDTGLAAFFGVSNIVLGSNKETYFSPSAEFNPFVHTWSLGVEEQFYLLFPLLLYFWLKGKHRYSVLLLGLLSVAFSAYYSATDLNAAYYLLTSRFWELAAGALLFQYHTANLNRPDSLANPFTIVVGLSLVVGGCVFSDKSAFPLPWGLLPVVGTVLMIHGFVVFTGPTPVKSLFSAGPVLYIGKLSYSLYLWHWPVYVVFRWTIGLQTVTEWLLAICSTFVLAMLSYHYLERQIPNLSTVRRLNTTRTLASGFLFIILSYTCALLAFDKQQRFSLSVTNDRFNWYPYYSHDSGLATGNSLNNRTLYVIGDSHAGAYSTMLRMLADETGIETQVYSQGGCGAANMRKPVLVESNSCKDKLRRWLHKVRQEAGPDDIIFLATLKMYRLTNQYRVKPMLKNEVVATATSAEAVKLRQQAKAETIRVIQSLAAVTHHIIIDAPKPVFAYIPFRCSDWYNHFNPTCTMGPEISRDFIEILRQPTLQSLQDVQRSLPYITIWDPLPTLCNDEICSVYDGDQPLFFDGDHLSAHGNRVIYPSFKKSVMRMVSNTT